MTLSAHAEPIAGGRRGGRPRRVAIVIFGLVPGGAERVVCELSSRWARAGDEVSVVTMAPPGTDVYRLASEVRRIALDLAGEPAGTMGALVRKIRRVRTLRRTLLGLRPDVVLSFMTETNLACLLALEGTGVPVVVCERTDPRHALSRRGSALLRRALYPRANAVVVQTEGVAAWARGFCARVHVVPNFIDAPARTAASLDIEGPKHVIAVGRLVRVKGFDLLIEAFSRVAAHRAEWSLVIVGEGPERPALQAQARALGIEQRVTLRGYSSNPLEQLVRAQLFVLSSRVEGFPNALMEAMACGLPSVSFDCPSGPSELIRSGHDGLLVPCGDVGALADALARLLDAPQERLAMGERAREVAVRFGSWRVLPMWTDVLDTTVHPSHARND